MEGKQLTATIGASNSTVAPGQRVALTLDVELEPNMHVYAPGVEGYIPIDWKMQDSDTAQVHAPVFPRAEKLYLKAIDETVPAFRSHFRLIRDITIPPEASSSRQWMARALRRGWHRCAIKPATIASVISRRRFACSGPSNARL